MVIALGAVYWLFLAISLGTLAKLLFVLSYSHAVIIVGFYVLAQVVKTWGEFVVFKKRGEILSELQRQATQQALKDATKGVANE